MAEFDAFKKGLEVAGGLFGDDKPAKRGLEVLGSLFGDDKPAESVDAPAQQLNKEKEELARSSKAAREALAMEFSGDIPVLPEIKAKFPVVDRDEEEDDVGHKTKFYTYRTPDGDTKTVSVYEYQVVLYRAQVQHFTELMKAPKRKIETYRTVAKHLDDRITQRVKEMDAKQEEIDDHADDVEEAKENRRLALARGEFEPGDEQDKALKRKIAAMSAESEELANFKKYVFGGYLVDLDDESGERKYCPDLREKRDAYNDRADKLENEVYNPLERLQKKSERALKKVQKDLDEFNKVWDD